MNKDTIVQFVCFTSDLETEGFLEMWNPFAKLLTDDPANILLRAATPENGSNRYNYVSLHMSGASDFRFAFMKDRSKTHFPENKARIKQAGGYLPLQIQCKHNNVKDDVRVVAFIPHGDTEMDFYRKLTFHYLNIYEAYFENCAYSYVMEFFIPQQETPVLLAKLKARPGVEAALYKQCRVSHLSKKVSGSLL